MKVRNIIAKTVSGVILTAVAMAAVALAGKHAVKLGDAAADIFKKEN